MTPLEKKIQRLTEKKERLEAELPDTQAQYDIIVQKLMILEERLASQQ